MAIDGASSASNPVAHAHYRGSPTPYQQPRRYPAAFRIGWYRLLPQSDGSGTPTKTGQPTRAGVEIPLNLSLAGQKFQFAGHFLASLELARAYIRGTFPQSSPDSNLLQGIYDSTVRSGLERAKYQGTRPPKWNVIAIDGHLQVTTLRLCGRCAFQSLCSQV